MQLWFAIIPLGAFACAFIFLGNQWGFSGIRQLITRTALLWGAYLVFGLEALSLFKGVTRLGLCLAWLLPITLFCLWAWRKSRAGEKVMLPKIQYPRGFGAWFLFACIIGVLFITGTVAWLAPPQTWDSLTYHMSRVAHWAQNHSIYHYITGIERQVSMSSGAESITLNFYVLTQGDRLAPFTQWLSMVISLIGVSQIANLLGAKSHGQWLSALIAAVIPIGIVESSSTITDYVVALWVVCIALESISFYYYDDRRSLFFVSLAAALAIFTKPISVPYLLPFGVWVAILLIKRRGLSGGLRWGAVALLIVVFINSGYIMRNFKTYGNVSNPLDFKLHNNQLHTLQGIISNVVKNAGLHLGLPYPPQLNDWWNLTILKIHYKLGVDIQDPRTTGDGTFKVGLPSTQEDRASAPYHAYLIAVTFLLMPFFWKPTEVRYSTGSRVINENLVIFYAILVASTFVLFSAIFKWHIFTVRYHLPFFVLFAPALGVFWGRGLRYNPFEHGDKVHLFRLGYLLGAFLLVSSYPWLFSIDSRPLIPISGRSTVGSILTEPREKLYFANSISLATVLKPLTEDIQSRGCTQVGIMLLGDDPEYLIWMLMGAPQKENLQIVWIVSGNTSRYKPLDFKPCAVICHGCGTSQQTIRGLNYAYQLDNWQLYLPPAP